MHILFVDHMNSKHPLDHSKCDFYEAYFNSPNEWFKHTHSHKYLKKHIHIHTILNSSQCSVTAHSLQKAQDSPMTKLQF